MSKIRIGLLGVGHLGRIHLRLLKAIPSFEVVGFYDPNTENAQRALNEYQVPRFENLDELLSACDAVDIVTPTTSHYAVAMAALNANCHIFIEKPLTHTLSEAREIIEVCRAKGLVGQVGHVERFNPAFLAIENRDLNPLFIEAQRLAVWNPRGTDVSVVQDLMIHDLDVILQVVQSPIKSVTAAGLIVASETPDIANASIEFENGCIAQLTTNRVSLKNVRKLKLFQPESYISMDFLNKKVAIVRRALQSEESDDSKEIFELASATGAKKLARECPTVSDVNAIQMELEEFAASIQTDAPVRVGLEAGYRAIEAAQFIMQAIEARKTLQMAALDKS